MNTKIYHNIDESGLAECGALLREGQLVAFPTETVYGLGAAVNQPEAVRNIFGVKNRPADNPLIAHIADIDMLSSVVSGDIPALVKRLYDAFSPGPLTVILPKSDTVSDIVTAGGSTVAVRIPSHPVARALIRAAGVAVVAPSANLSGRPSPTDFMTTAEDLDGKIAAIIDGGACSVGVESTVLLPVGDTKVRVLRPGGITPEMIEKIGISVDIDPNVVRPPDGTAPVLSPGMKHRHYAPHAPLTIVKGEKAAVLKFLKEKQAAGAGILCFENELDGNTIVTYGKEHEAETQSQKLFAALRQFDRMPVTEIFARCPDTSGVGLAVYNRLLRAAEFHIIEVKE